MSKWMHFDWAVRWMIIMVLGPFLGVVMLVLSLTIEDSDSGLMRAFGILFLGLGLLGGYMTYRNFSKK